MRIKTVSFGEWMKQRRKLLNLTQEALGKRVGCSVGTIRKIEANRRRPSRQVAERLADALQIAAEQRSRFVEAARATQPGPADAHDNPSRHATAAETGARVPGPRLPAPLTPLIGRNRELNELAEILSRKTTRLLTCIGPPGVGKTRLCVELASVLAQTFSGGVSVVPLASVIDPALVAPTVAHELGIKAEGIRPILDQLIDAISDQQILIILDNVEQVCSGAALVAELLVACPRLKILVTSRAPLHLRGEQQFPVAPLAVPDLAQLPAPEIIAGYPAVELFAERARAIQPGLALAADNTEAIARLCALLDGLPLAIELVAPTIKLFSVQALLARLNDQLSPPASVLDLPPREQTLRRALDWSYEQLHADERQLFNRLAVFVGGCSPDAAAAVCGTSGNLQADLLDALGSLVDKNLLRRETGGEGEPRFTMHGAVLDYTTEQLRACGQLDELRQNHAAYFLALAEDLAAPGRGATAEQLDQEHDNLRAALRWACDYQEWEIALRFCAALWWFWHNHGYQREGRTWMEMALRHSAAIQTATRAQVLYGLGRIANDQADFTRASALFHESLTLAREVGDMRTIAQSLHGFGEIAIFRGNWTQAATLFEESLALLRDVDDIEELAWSLDHLGRVVMEKGDHQRARALIEEALRLFRTRGDHHGTAWTLNHLGLIATQLDDYGQAKALLEEAMALFRKQSDHQGMAWTLDHLGRVSLEEGDYARATTLLEKALDLFRTLGNDHGMAWALDHLGETANAQGDYGRATALFEEALALFKRQGNDQGAGWMLYHLALAAAWQGYRQRRTALLHEALVLFDKLRDQKGIALCLTGLADIQGRAGQRQLAAQLVGIASALIETLNVPLSPGERTKYDQTVLALKAVIGEQAFAEATPVADRLAGWEAIRLVMHLLQPTPAPTTGDAQAQHAPVSRPEIGRYATGDLMITRRSTPPTDQQP